MALIGNPLMPLHPPQDPLALIHAALAARRVDPPVGQGPPGPFHHPLPIPGGPPRRNLDDYIPDEGPPRRNLDDYIPDGPHRQPDGIGAILGGGGGLLHLLHPEAAHTDPLQHIRSLLEQLGIGQPAGALDGFHTNPEHGAGGIQRFLQPADRVEGLADALRGSHHSYQEPRARRSMLAHAAGGHGQMRAY